MIIYHITDAARWERALEAGIYKHESLKTEGFIHCSTQEQLQETMNLYFADAQEIWVLHIVDRRVKEILKWEESRNNVLFPHIYGHFPITAVETLSQYIRNKAGEWELV